MRRWNGTVYTTTLPHLRLPGCYLLQDVVCACYLHSFAILHYVWDAMYHRAAAALHLLHHCLNHYALPLPFTLLSSPGFAISAVYYVLGCRRATCHYTQYLPAAFFSPSADFLPGNALLQYPACMPLTRARRRCSSAFAAAASPRLTCHSFFLPWLVSLPWVGLGRYHRKRAHFCAYACTVLL